jgi:hypothetical protein
MAEYATRILRVDDGVVTGVERQERPALGAIVGAEGAA